MKKTLSTLIVALLTLILVFSLSACIDSQTPDVADGAENSGDKTEHTHSPNPPVRENEIKAACMVDGSYDEVVYCSGCDQEISRTPKTAKASGHKYRKGECRNCGWLETYSEGLIYVSTGIDTCSVSGIGGCEDKVVSIPHISPSGAKVTGVASTAFKDNKNITGVILHDGVTSIGDRAFRGCSRLKSITMPNSLTEIGADAFYACAGLSDVVLPNCLVSIGKDAFSWCKAITDIKIPSSLTSVGDGAFSLCDELVSVEFDNDCKLTSISSRMFKGCGNLASITIPDSVTSIGASAFESCHGLKTVVLGNSVTTIANGAFYWCTGLMDITIPKSLTTVADSAFIECAYMRVYYVGSRDDWGKIRIGIGNYHMQNAAIRYNYLP